MKDKKVKENLPGYPHYPQEDDIMRQEARTEDDVEQLSRSHKVNKDFMEELPAGNNVQEDATPEIIAGNEADVTEEDLAALGDPQQDQDGGDDETVLPSIRLNEDIMGGDLDIPGAEDADDRENRGTEDEENNFFSRGQD